jgi:hypothetical protein
VDKSLERLEPHEAQMLPGFKNASKTPKSAVAKREGPLSAGQPLVAFFEELFCDGIEEPEQAA